MEDKKVIKELFDIAAEAITLIYDDPRWEYASDERQQTAEDLNARLYKIRESLKN